MSPTLITLLVAVLANTALVLAAIVSRRSTQTEKAKTGVEILQSVATELRTELDRKTADQAKALMSAANTIKRQDDEIEMLRDELMNARKAERGAYEAGGRAHRRVDYLEQVLRDNGITYDPGPLA